MQPHLHCTDLVKVQQVTPSGLVHITDAQAQLAATDNSTSARCKTTQHSTAQQARHSTAGQRAERGRQRQHLQVTYI